MAHHRQLTQGEISSDGPNNRHLEHMAVRASTRLDSPLQGPNLPVLVPAGIFSLQPLKYVLASRPGFSSNCCRTCSQTVLNGSSRVRQCRTFVTSLGKLAVAVFLRVIGHPPRRTGRRQHDPNTYAGQVSRRLTERTHYNTVRYVLLVGRRQSFTRGP